MHRLLRILLAPVLVVLVTAACGGSGDDTQTVGAADDQEQAAETPEPESAETPATTIPVEVAPPTTVPPSTPPPAVPPASVVAEPPAQTPTQPATPAAPTTGRVDGTYTASDQASQTEVVLRVAGGDPVASVQGTGDLPFVFEGVAPGRYVIEASERGPEVADPNGAATSSATTVRSAPFDLEAGYTWTFSCDTNGCGD